MLFKKNSANFFLKSIFLNSKKEMWHRCAYICRTLGGSIVLIRKSPKMNFKKTGEKTLGKKKC
jgi:hypothetical protein